MPGYRHSNGLLKFQLMADGPKLLALEPHLQIQVFSFISHIQVPQLSIWIFPQFKNQQTFDCGNFYNGKQPR